MVAFSQPSSDAYCLNGYQFFRLNTLLSSAGDIFESKQSGHAFMIGPESDVAEVNVAYFDDQADSFLNQIVIGPDRAWNGRIDARNEATYAPSGRPGRILIWPSNYWDPDFVPSNFGIGKTLFPVTPRLDVIEYFKPQSVVPSRNDGQFIFQNLALGANGGFYIIPYWGRRTASCRVTNLTSGDITWTLTGVNYYNNDTGAALEVQLDNGVVTSGNQRLKIVKEGVDGNFDALMFFVNLTAADGPIPVQIITSDTPVG